jgi:DNA adenine methylase
MFVERLRGVIIERLDWRKVFDLYDAPGVLWYIDPPYPLSTRTGGHRRTYGAFEMSDDDHRELCRRADGLKGFVLISTYKNAIYDDLLKGWTLDTIAARAQCNSKRTEALYISPHTASSTMQSLFEVSACS